MAGMTKKDREELDARIDGLDYYRRLSIKHCLNYGMTSKRAELEKLRAEEAAAQAEAEAEAEEVAAEVAEAIAAADLSPADPAKAAAAVLHKLDAAKAAPQETEIAHEIKQLAIAADNLRDTISAARHDGHSLRTLDQIIANAHRQSEAHAARLWQLAGDMKRAKDKDQ